MADKKTLEPTRLDLGKVIRFSLWFFVIELALKLFWIDDISWWTVTAPLWTSLMFTMATPLYDEKGNKKHG